MTTEGMEAQEQAWKEWIAYRKRNSRMTLDEERDISLEMGVFDSYEEPKGLLEDPEKIFWKETLQDLEEIFDREHLKDPI